MAERLSELFAKLIEPKGIPGDPQNRFPNHRLAVLTVPVLLEQLLSMTVGIADSMMISYAGEAAISGVSLVNQVNVVFIMVFNAIAAGGTVIASQYIGKGDQTNGRRTSGQLTMFSVAVSLMMTAVVILSRRTMLSLLFGSVEADVMTAALQYLVIMAFSFPAMAIYNSGAAVYRAMGQTKVTMQISMIMNVCNVIGNAIGIFVLHAGVAGVAVPSVLSWCLAAGLMFRLSVRKTNFLAIQRQNIFSWNGDILRRILHVAVPSAIENGLFQLAKVAMTAIIALFGTSQIAANGTAQTFWTLGGLFATAMGVVYVTVVGQCMGSRDVEAADYYIKKLLRITFLGSISWNAALLVISPLILTAFDLSAETMRLTVTVVLMHSVLAATLHPCAFALSNGLRAAGDVRFTMGAAIFSTVVCRVAFALLFGVRLGMGLIGVVFAMALDWAIKSALIYGRYKSGAWSKFRIID